MIMYMKNIYISSLLCIHTYLYITYSINMFPLGFRMAFTAGSFLALALSMIFPQALCLTLSAPSEVLESLRHYRRWEMLRSYLLIFIMILLAIYSIHRIGELEVGHDHAGHSHGHGGHGHEL